MYLRKRVFSGLWGKKGGGGKCDSRVSTSTDDLFRAGKFFNVAQHLCQVGRHRPYKIALIAYGARDEAEDIYIL